jgi:hypothetical protein
LQDQELKAERFLGLYYRRMSSAYFQIKAARAQRDAFATQLRVQYDFYRVGINDPATGKGVTLNLLLEAQRFWSDALATEYQAIVTYNNAIAGWEYAKGTILQHDNVTISEGPIPVAAQKRAVEHLRERTKALLLRERAKPTGILAAPLERSGPINVYPQINANSLPSIWKDMPPLKEAEELPPADRIERDQVDQLPNAVENMSQSELFPKSELPGGGKTPTAAAPAELKGLPPKSAHPKTPARTTSTFGTLRPADSSPMGTPMIPAKPIATTPPASSSQPLLPLP